ncbi:MAG: BACON domain-containing protein [Planctomycetaceae bacterium]|jgi:hypothetical protein|nr:BACON domain-containing protein [Planctomycetaceae bacterium]
MTLASRINTLTGTVNSGKLSLVEWLIGHEIEAAVTESLPGLIAKLNLLSNPDPNLSFTFQGGQEVFPLFFPSGSAWTVIQQGEWFTVSPMTGTGNANITLTVPLNTTQEVRSGLINVTDGGANSYIIHVDQGVTSEILSVTKSLGNILNRNIVNVTSNTVWNIEKYTTSVWTPIKTLSGNQEFSIQTENSNLQSYRIKTVSGSYVITSPSGHGNIVS